MKKDRKSRETNKDLYWAMDMDYSVSQEDQARADSILNKHKVRNVFEDTRYYGLFLCGEDKRVKIDPIRYAKKIGLSERQKEYINKRKTHYFSPSKKNYSDYNCNIFRKEISEIRSKWKEEHKPIVDAAIEKIKARKYDMCNDEKLMCGICGPNGANARAQWATMKAKAEAEYKKFALKTSMYAEFFHLMASRIEATTVFVLTKNGFEGDKFGRNELYAFKGNKQEKISELVGFAEYDKMYCIWNFIKHNSLSTYNSLKDKYPEVIANNSKYKQGELAIHYVKIDEMLILDLLNGIEKFFDAYCKLVFDEDVDSADWNYDGYFLSSVNSKIEPITNPLGLDVFDELD